MRADGKNPPCIHLVDGGISDDVGMRGVPDAWQLLEALHGAGTPTPLDRVKQIVVFDVNSLSSPPTASVLPPEAVDRLRAAAGTIIAESPEFQRLLTEAGVKIVTPAAAGKAAPAGAP